MRCSIATVCETGRMTVAIVDSCSSDYASSPPHAVDRPYVDWHFGPAAVVCCDRRSARVDLWVVNTMLPDISGIDLCGMLKGRSPPPAVYIVTDAYRMEDERGPCCGVSLFACKPVQASWFKN